MCELIRSKYFIFASSVFQVLITGRENPDVEVSPAMDAAIRIFKCVAGLNNDDPGAVAAFVSSKLLVASAQAIHLIGKKGSTINSIQERSGVVLRVLLVGEIFMLSNNF